MKQRADHANGEQCHAAIVDGLRRSAHCVLWLVFFSQCDRSGEKVRSGENVGGNWQD